MIAKIDWNILSHSEFQEFYNQGMVGVNCEIYLMENNKRIPHKDTYKFSSQLSTDGFDGDLLLLRYLDSFDRFIDITNNNQFYKEVLKHIGEVEGFTGTFGIELSDAGVVRDYTMDTDGNYYRTHKFIRLIA